VSISVLFEALFLLFCIPVSLIYHESEVISLVLTFVMMFLFSGSVFLVTKSSIKNYTVKDNYLSVVFTWFFISLFGALPYIVTGSIPEFKDAFFEAVSGFTTTGSSILNDIESMPKSLLFWRAETHWLGGMGIIVLVIAFLPYFQIGGQQMIMAEGSFFSSEKIKSRTIDVAKRMWLIYVVLTFAETLALYLSGMDLFDSVCHSFATVATGGFSTKNSSLVDVAPIIQYIIILFMILSGMNFTLHYLLVHGRVKKVFRDEEMKVYLVVILLTAVIIGIIIHGKFQMDWETAFRDSLFQVASIITATGFVSANYQVWPALAKIFILMLMLTGACAGSTGGGIKVARYVLIFKNMGIYLKKIIQPNAVQVARYNGKPVSLELSSGVIGFIFIYYATIVFGTFVMLLSGMDKAAASSSIITTLGGIGPGFNAVGPVENFSAISTFGKYYLSFNMILGRLEILSVLVLFVPSFHKKL
jgi:trk system potassium uptake protein TrkH